MQYSETDPTDSTTLESNIEKRDGLIYPKLLDGDGLHDRNGQEVCSVGLWVQDSNGQDYIMTAGHCGSRSPRNQQGFVDFYQKGWYSPATYRYIGPLEYYSPSPYDFGLIRKIGTNVSLSTDISNLDLDHPNNYAVLYIRDVSVVTSVGASLCKSAYITHVTCGEVLELDVVTTHMGSNNQSRIKKEMIRTNLNGGPGDSGGIVYTYSARELPFVSVVGTVVGGGEGFCNILPLPVSFRVSRSDYNLNLSVIVTHH
ncbi:serine protease [Gigaspora margarita]|uniref:Serine protease n=1 Tax=Gigaspora margarita TaxID=4874 RepID=A0A8H4B1L7_GIGMA|nr:serine protease [Gigaspora margarita]